jgi:hypothetical protein
MKRYRGAIQGWQRVRVQRENAVMGITFSLPGMLCSGAFFMIGGEEVKPGNWAAFGVLLYCSLHVTYAVLAMESNFTRAEVVDEDVRAMLAWTKVSNLVARPPACCATRLNTRTRSSALFRNTDLARHQHRGRRPRGALFQRSACRDSQETRTGSHKQSRKLCRS